MYSRNRMALSDEQQSIVQTGLLLQAGNHEIKSLLEADGKYVTSQDLRNLKTKQRHCEKQGRTDVQILLDDLIEIQRLDPSAVVRMSKDSVSNELKYLIFQSGHMRNTFKAYLEHLLLDSIYLLNNCRMPLLTIMAVDGNNESSIVALILLSAETIDILVEVLGQVKEDNPWQVLSFMVDKDMAEILALKSLWPNATVEICLFHVLKAMKLKVSSLVCSAEAKDQVRQVFQRLAYSETPQIYEERVADLQALNVPQTF